MKWPVTKLEEMVPRSVAIGLQSKTTYVPTPSPQVVEVSVVRLMSAVGMFCVGKVIVEFSDSSMKNGAWIKLMLRFWRFKENIFFIQNIKVGWQVNL